MKPSLILAILVIGIILGAGGYLIAKNFSNLDKDIVQDNNKIPAVSPPPGKFQTVCGNQVCESGEDVKNCPSDCGGGITPPPGGKIPGPTPPPGGPTSPPVTPPPAGSPPPTAGFVNLPTLGSLNLTHGFFIRSFPQGNYLYLATGESARGFKVADISNPANPRIIAERSPGGMWSDDVFIEGNYAYLTTRVGSAGLVIYNISNPNNPTQVGKWSTSQEIHSIAVSGNYAYVGISAAGSNNFRVIDVSNKANPVQVGQATFTGSAARDYRNGANERIVVSGNYVYVASGFTGLDIFDVSNPNQPVKISNFSIASGEYANDVAVSGSKAYLAAGKNLKIIDISNPASPQLLGVYSGLYQIRSVAISGNTGFVVGTKAPGATSDSQIKQWNNINGAIEARNAIQAINVGNPASVSVIGEYINPGFLADLGSPYDFVIITPTRAFVSDHSFGVRIVNISNPSNPALLGSLHTYGEVRDFYVNGTTGFTLHDPTGVVTAFNISSPANMQKLGSVESGLWINGLNNLEGKGSTLYANSSYDTVIINAANPGNMSVVGNIPLPGKGRAISVDGSYLYIAYVGNDGKLHLRVFSLTNPNSPSQVSDVIVSQVGAKSAGHIRVSGNRAYIADFANVYIINVINKQSPAVLGQYALSGLGLSQVTSASFYPPLFAANGNFLYFVRTFQGVPQSGQGRVFAVLDATNGASPQLKGSISQAENWQIGDVKVYGNLVFASDYERGIRVINVSDPNNPSYIAREAGTITFPGNEGYDAGTIIGTKLFAAKVDHLEVLDVSPILE